MTARCRMLATVLAALVAALPARSFETVTAPTVDPPRQLQILLGNSVGGLAVDRAGNRYVSSRSAATVFMIPRGETRAIVIVGPGIQADAPVEPGDVEMSASGRSLLVADGTGRVLSIPFGLTVELVNGLGAARTDCTLYVQTDQAGTSAPVRYYFGFYSVPRLMSLDPQLTEQSARILVDCDSSPTRAFDVGLGQPDGLFGQTFVRLVVP